MCFHRTIEGFRVRIEGKEPGEKESGVLFLWGVYPHH